MALLGVHNPASKFQDLQYILVLLREARIPPISVNRQKDFLMKHVSCIAALALVAGTAAIPMSAALADNNAKPPAATRYYPFIGFWRGHGQLSEPGKAPIALKLAMSCRKASMGWAVRCDLVAKNKQMTMTEADLMGVDSVTGTGHWYAVTNQGETHDHITQWTDPNDMKAHYSWMQDGKKMEENISVSFKGGNQMEFRSATTADGKDAGVFSGKVSR